MTTQNPVNGPDQFTRAFAQVNIPVSLPTRLPGQGLTQREVQSMTLENVTRGAIGQALRQAIDLPQGNPDRVDFLDVSQNWARQPWLAYPFLARTLFSAGSPMMAVLQHWHGLSGNQVDQNHLVSLWENSTDPQVVATRQRWSQLHPQMIAYLNTSQRTIEHLRSDRQQRATNFLERAGGDFWDYTWHEMADHPVTSGLLLFGGGMAVYSLIFGRLGRTPLGKVMKVGIGLTAVICFLRDKYGVEIVEDLFARPLERWGAPGAAQWLRNFRDTVTDPFRMRDGNEQGSARAYLMRNKLQLRGPAEEAMGDVILGMPPNVFFNLMNTANQAGSLSAPPFVPPELRAELNRMRNNREIAGRLEALDATEQMRLFRSVGEKFLRALPFNSRDEALAYVGDRYVTGQWFVTTTAETQVGTVNGVPQSLARASVMTRGVPQMRLATQRANQNRSYNMLYVMIDHLSDADWDNIARFGGPSEQAARDLVRGTRDAAVGAFNAALDLGSGVVNFFTGDVPRYWREHVWPAIQRQGPRVQAAISELKAVGQRGVNAVVWFGDNTTVGRIMRDVLGWSAEQAREGYRITANEAYRLAVFLEYQRLQEGVGNADINGWLTSFMQDFGAAPGDAQTITFRGDWRIWRAVHDQGIAQILNRSSIGLSGSGGVEMSREQAERLRQWVETVQGFQSGSSVNGGSTTVPPLNPTTNPVPPLNPNPLNPVPPLNSGSNNPVPPLNSGPSLSEEERIDALIRMVADLEIAPNFRGLAARREGGNITIFFNNPRRPDRPFAFSRPRSEILAMSGTQLLERWRDEARQAIQRDLDSIDTVENPQALNARPWTLRFLPLGRVGVKSSQEIRGTTHEAEVPFHQLLQYEALEIFQAHQQWAQNNTAETRNMFAVDGQPLPGVVNTLGSPTVPPLASTTACPINAT